MVLGVPVIASDCIGLREVLDGAPMVLTSSSEMGSLAHGVLKMRQERETLRGACGDYRHKARERFDIAASAKTLRMMCDRFLNTSAKECGSAAEVGEEPDAVTPECLAEPGHREEGCI